MHTIINLFIFIGIVLMAVATADSYIDAERKHEIALAKIQADAKCKGGE